MEPYDNKGQAYVHNSYFKLYKITYKVIEV